MNASHGSAHGSAHELSLSLFSAQRDDVQMHLSELHVRGDLSLHLGDWREAQAEAIGKEAGKQTVRVTSHDQDVSMGQQ